MVITTDEEYWKKYEREEEEVMKDQMMLLDYPAPDKRYRLINESFSMSIEESYFWILNYMKYDLGFADVEKITDIFTAAETSAFGGMAQQRVGATQDKVSQFLAAIGKMVKELFQLVRELRVLDERLGYYDDAKNPDARRASPADITLKGIYIDMAEGGSKSPASVYGMARELQFTTLPDIFFSNLVQTIEEIDEKVDKLEFNKVVKNVLKRKLHAYIRWRDSTHKEMKSRRTFTLRYLKQHYDIIKMYMSWVKPYLKRIRRLQGEEKSLESPDIINAFETSMIEIEILGKFKPRNNKKVFAVILMNFEFRTKPSLNYQAENYQRGPIHVGELKMKYRTYNWTQEDIDNYKALRNREDFALLNTVDGSVKAAMEALGGELERYLAEAGEQGLEIKKEEPKKKIKLPGIFEPFIQLGKAFTSVGEALTPKKSEKPSKKDMYELEKEKIKASGDMAYKIWLLYKNYKKSHKMLSW